MQVESLFAKQIGEAQFDFYRRNKAGCLFAAIAAKHPMRYGWIQRVLPPREGAIDKAIEQAMGDRSVTMLSIVFPAINTPSSLIELIYTLRECRLIYLDQNDVFEDCRCLGFRARVDDLSSWISGFGPFTFLPVTRRAPYTEITFRVKPRPNFKWVMKKSPPAVIHLADLDMLGMADATFRTVWRATLKRTAQLLGHEPDLRSAAKTTFSVPTEIWLDTYLSNVNINGRSNRLDSSNSLPLAS